MTNNSLNLSYNIVDFSLKKFYIKNKKTYFSQKLLWEELILVKIL